MLHTFCWDCRSQPDFARGERGTGNTGGFGFAPRRVDLASYESIAAGSMPLGLPALSSEDIPLVESWIAQGHRR